MALVFGEQQAVSPQEWQQLRDGGIIHLIAISGLHIGLIGGLAFYLMRLAAARMPGLCRRAPATRPGHARHASPWTASCVLTE